MATLLLLQQRGRVTAAELAEELEVSVPTARRDLEALSTAGIPVYAQPGRGGGWQLVGGARTDLSGLTASEAQALFLLAGPTTPVSGDARNALRKLVQALPSTFRADAEAAAASTIIDPASWGGTPHDPPALVEPLQRAVVERVRVRITYASRRRPASSRVVDPWGLIDKDGLWYLVAGTDRGRRTFRVDRMTSVESTDEPAERPGDFALRDAWVEITDDLERQRSKVRATVVLPSHLRFVIEAQFGRHGEHVTDLADGRVRMRVAASSVVDVARQLAGWGADLIVEEPPSVRAELARIAAELTATYAAPDVDAASR